jgi:adenylate cyclase
MENHPGFCWKMVLPARGGVKAAIPHGTVARMCDPPRRNAANRGVSLALSAESAQPYWRRDWGGAWPMTRLRELIRRESRRGLSFPPWLDRLLSLGIVSTDPQVVRRQRCVNASAYAAVASGASYIALTSFYDLLGLLPLNAYNALLVVVAAVLPFSHRLGEHFAAIVLVSLVGAGQLYVVWMLGLSSELHIFYLLGGASLFFFGIQNWKLFAGFFVCIALLLVFTINVAPVEGLLLPDDGRLRELISSQTMLSVLLINAALIFYALTLVHSAEVGLQQEHERSEALIATVMPGEIAARLKTSEDRIADRIGMLSVVFADLVGFTSAARDQSPDAVVGFLDGLVRALDALAAQHGVEKIKTIGDCYMAAAGFDGRAHDGAVAIGRFALAVMDANAAHGSLGGRKLDLRVGIHCGAATAGVIGETRFSYDIWGDAVNVAARMESHGLPGRIQASEAFRELTAGEFAFEERGTIEIKGLGDMKTYFLGRALRAGGEAAQSS